MRFEMTGIRVRISGLQASDWRHSNHLFLATFGGILAAVYLFILLVDPYGVVPFSLPFERPIMSSQRQMYPQILRTGRYDSIVVGTSTSRLLDPAALERVLGGRFATFAMNSMTAWEQVQAIDYFRRTVAAPKALLIGIDDKWCNPTGGDHQRDAEFPLWAYDGNRWNDLLYLLNNPTLEVAAHTVGRVLGWQPEKLREDGFEEVSSPESPYDIERARRAIYAGAGEHRPVEPAAEASEAGPDAMIFETLPWLDESLAGLPDATRKFLVFPPVHAHALPAAGSRREARDSECKKRVATIARRHGALLVDWRMDSPLTGEDSHFWDPIHYRLPIAYRLIDDLDHIVNEGRESSDGCYRILVRWHSR
jgi:hypothetical protein